MPRDRLDDAFVVAVRVTRVVTLLWAVCLAPTHSYAHPGVATAVVLGMVAWTGVTVACAARPGLTLLVADLVLTWLAIASTSVAESAQRIAAGDPTVPSTWAAAAVVAWALARGPLWGAAAGLVTATASVVVMGDLPRDTFANGVLLVLLGLLVGMTGRLARQGAQRIAAAEALAATELERERLARDVHDGVLQLLTLVSRLDPSVTLPDGSPLPAAAAEQERSLRRLISGPAPAPVGQLDLLAALPQGDDVRLVGPGSAVTLPAQVATALAAAAGAAIANVRVHTGGPAYVLVDDLGDHVEVIVRDDGPGFDVDAVDTTRMGLRGMRERLALVGGTVDIVSSPADGTAVTLSVPRTTS